ncbi:MAG: hypothetical protein IOB85_09090 [Methylobacterium sp.]|nr:hypothetical protein [Methylobacterium sp.]MCA3659358.1 hypothetical protein [Methylobacterium sp.]MCA3662527.1 hypothetical protein [Methylobacterium sp.]MCA3668175.1 hypothetical protein [Methylobacterium sp.]MCA3672616.1 hypothetical protein [Methylobacterium sp.]
METMIRRYAQLSIARGCGFGALAIATVMVGSASNLSLFLRSGGFATLLMCFILLIMAARADHVPVKRTEVWIMLPKENRPPVEVAAPLIARARKDYLLRFAYVAAIVASVELGLDLALSVGRLA